MFKSLFKQNQRNKKIKEISKLLGDHNFYRSNDPRSHAQELAYDELFPFCEGDSRIRPILTKYNADTDTLKTIYRKLHEAGGGQWIGSIYVPVSALNSINTLEYLLKNKDKSLDDFFLIANRVMKYFREDQISPIQE